MPAVGLALGTAPRLLEERRPALLAEVKGHVKNVYNTRTQMAGVILHCTKNRQRAGDKAISRPTTPISERYKILVVPPVWSAAFSRFVPLHGRQKNRADRLISFRVPPTIDRGCSTYISFLAFWFACIFIRPSCPSSSWVPLPPPRPPLRRS